MSLREPLSRRSKGRYEDLAGLGLGAIEELPRAARPSTPPALAHLEQELFADEPEPRVSLDGAIRFLEAAGGRGTAELVASEVAALVRGGTPRSGSGWSASRPRDGALRWRRPSPSCRCRCVVESRRRLGETALGRSLLALLHFAWRGGRAKTSSPTSGRRIRASSAAPRTSSKDGFEGAPISDPARVEEEAEKLRGAPVPALVELRESSDPVSAVLALAGAMMRNAWGLEAPPVVDNARADARAFRAAERTLADLGVFRDEGSSLSPDDVLVALERTSVPPESPAAGRVAVLDHERARTRSFEVVFVLGLEEGAFRAAHARRRSWATISGASSAGGSSAPTRSRATATSSIRPARGRRVGSSSSASPPATRACRGSRAPSGTTSALSSTRPRCSARRSGARCPR